jgi:hypothetical protein
VAWLLRLHLLASPAAPQTLDRRVLCTPNGGTSGASVYNGILIKTGHCGVISQGIVRLSGLIATFSSTSKLTKITAMTKTVQNNNMEVETEPGCVR